MTVPHLHVLWVCFKRTLQQHQQHAPQRQRPRLWVPCVAASHRTVEDGPSNKPLCCIVLESWECRWGNCWFPIEYHSPIVGSIFFLPKPNWLSLRARLGTAKRENSLVFQQFFGTLRVGAWVPVEMLFEPPKIHLCKITNFLWLSMGVHVQLSWQLRYLCYLIS